MQQLFYQDNTVLMTTRKCITLMKKSKDDQPRTGSNNFRKHLITTVQVVIFSLIIPIVQIAFICSGVPYPFNSSTLGFQAIVAVSMGGSQLKLSKEISGFIALAYFWTYLIEFVAADGGVGL